MTRCARTSIGSRIAAGTIASLWLALASVGLIVEPRGESRGDEARSASDSRRAQAAPPHEIRTGAKHGNELTPNGLFHEAWGSAASGAGSTAQGGIAGGSLSACCLPGGACMEVATEPECIAAGGIFFPAANCAGGFCEPAACCDEFSCGVTDAFNCIFNGRQYAGPGVTCFDDPCGAGQGACCLGGDNCEDLPPLICEGVGGNWLGAGTSCAAGSCDLGACCLPGECIDTTISHCLFVLGGEFSQDALCDQTPCSAIPVCGDDSLFGFEPAEPFFFAAGLSDTPTGIVRADRFDNVAGAIERVTFWGLDLTLESEKLVECDESDFGVPLFDVTFHADDGPTYGEPGSVVCNFTVPATRTPTGVLYMGFELNQYEVVLPSACVLTRGWISISGAFGNSCLFYWMSSNDGDDRSWCGGCPQPGADDQPFDLSFCLAGQIGGVSGACCDLSIGTCDEDVDISLCATNGQVFTPGATCAQAPPCAPTQGACCLPDGNCFFGLPSECQLAAPPAGGTWFGPTATCDDCPSLGACCFTFEKCLLTPQSECLNDGGFWGGQGAACDVCPTQPMCDDDSFISQIPDGPIGFIAGSSEVGSLFKRFEDFTNVTGAVSAIRFWGFDLVPIPGSNNFLECDEPDPTFLITFHVDANGVPGAEVCSSVATASVMPFNLSFQGATLKEYYLELPEPCALTNGWVSIQGMGDPTCWFLWQSSGVNKNPPGSGSYCQGCLAPFEGFDLSMCLIGEEGGVFGACCDDETGACNDNVEITKCASPDLRFTPGTSCAELEVECGVILGACCTSKGQCSIVTEDECAGDGEDWLGPNSICSSCPCVVPCSPGSVPEDEPPCFDGYVDTINGGCFVEEPAFSSITPGQTICGTSGFFITGGATLPDFDWYEITLTTRAELVWSGEAEFTSQFGIVDGNFGCPDSIDDLIILAAVGALPCSQVSTSAEVGPGTYWLVVGPLGLTDKAVCGAAYTVKLDVNAKSIPGDLNGDGTVGVADLLILLSEWGTCMDCDACPADVDSDCAVGVSDLLILLSNWG